jgi:mycofactocin precursor
MPPSVGAVGEICPTAVSITRVSRRMPVNNQQTIEADPATTAASDGEPTTEPVAEQLVEESLVEEVSIDGMCGVY